LGALFGGGLAYAAKVFYVEKDAKIDEINSVLPQANCGGCGYPGCEPFAEAVAKGEAPVSGCTVGGAEVARRISAIMGIEAGDVVEMVAVVRCRGSKEAAKDKYEYHGIRDCNAEVLLSGGHKACEYGCLGGGSCVDSCEFDAMIMQDNGLPKVFYEKCVACGACVEACPKGIMELIPRTQKVFVACVSQDRGKEVKEVCSVGCTGCTLCANPKFNPQGGDKVVMENNLPLISADWRELGQALEKCPVQCLIEEDRTKRAN
jgi:Na+-translocating ferredoxin:NAD+ oxidoreductase RNF subunit RnfB